MASYRIMREGEEYLQRERKEEGVRVIYIDGSSAWTDRRVLIEKLAEKLGHDVLVLDKFVGVDTLALLAKFGKKRRVRFLTAQVSGNQTQFRRDLRLFRQEYRNIDIRMYPYPKKLHDRYLLSGGELYIFGHGLKDFGKSESFVLVLKGSYGKEIRQLLKEKFESRWNDSNAVQL